MTKPWRNITTIWSDKKNCVFVFISVNLTGDSTLRLIVDHGDPVSGAPAIGEAALDSLTDFFAFGLFIPSFVHWYDLLPTGFFR